MFCLREFEWPGLLRSKGIKCEVDGIVQRTVLVAGENRRWQRWKRRLANGLNTQIAKGIVGGVGNKLDAGCMALRVDMKLDPGAAQRE